MEEQFKFNFTSPKEPGVFEEKPERKAEINLEEGEFCYRVEIHLYEDGVRRTVYFFCRADSKNEAEQKALIYPANRSFRIGVAREISEREYERAKPESDIRTGEGREIGE